MAKSTLLRAVCVTAGMLLGLVVWLFSPIGLLVVVGGGAAGYALAEVIDRKRGLTQRECDAVDPWKRPLAGDESETS